MKKNIEDIEIAILLCTYNGEKFLREQLDSFVSQTHKNISIWVSDDGSTDSTLEILREYQKVFGEEKFKILPGPKEGCVQNFFYLTYNEEIKADYYAYSDQDDIWYPDKLKRSLEKIITYGQITPVLYGSRTKLIYEGKENGEYLSPLFPKEPCFRNAIVQSIAGGNTMLMNNASKNLLQKAAIKNVISHDWWAYILISAAGGEVIYDPEPTLLYRQHDNNLTGANIGIMPKIKRISMLMQGSFRHWNDLNIAALDDCSDFLTKDNLEILKIFKEGRNSFLLKRLYLFWKIRIFRQTFLWNIGLFAAAILKRM